MQQLISYPEQLPFYPSVLSFLEQVFFLFHIISINLIVGLVLIFGYLEIRKKEKLFSEEVRFFVKKIPIFFALGINLAIPALLFLQVLYGPLFYTSSIIIATHWILIIPAIMAVYYLSYLISKRINQFKSSRSIFVFKGLVLMYVAFVLVSNLVLMENPEKWQVYFEHSKGYYLPLGITYLYFRYLHFLVASIAIGGLALSLYGTWIKSEGLKREGLRLFFYSTLIQVFIGVVFVFSLPSQIRIIFLEGRSGVSLIFYINLFFVFMSLYYSRRGSLKYTIFWLFLTLVGMLINRFHLRTLNLSEVYDFSNISVKVQIEAFLVFLGVFVLGLGLIYYMVKNSLIKKEG